MLFGARSVDVSLDYRTKAQWIKLLSKINDEMMMYVKQNIVTDKLHYQAITESIIQAKKTLKNDPFFIEYIGNLLKIIFLLMGHFPNHCIRESGRKSNDFYNLNRHRTINYSMSKTQKYRLIADFILSHKEFYGKSYRDFWSEYYHCEDYDQSEEQFVDWFCQKYPEEYVKFF
jgi:hypothetical protein